MAIDCIDWAELYRDERPKYEQLAKKTVLLLKEIFENEGIKAIFQSRVKDLISFKEKIERPGKS